MSFPSAGDTARRAEIGFARHPVIRRQRKERRPLPAVELRSWRVSSTVMRCMRCSKRSEPNGSRPDRSADGRETCGARTPLERVAVGSARSASDWGICDLRIALHWQRNLGSRVVLPSKARPHTSALCEEAYVRPWPQSPERPGCWRPQAESKDTRNPFVLATDGAWAAGFAVGRVRKRRK